MIPGWTTERLSRHDCDFYEPPTLATQPFVVIYLHGVHLGTLRDNRAFTDLFARFGLRAVAPHTKRSWWTNRICQEFDPQITAEQFVLDSVLPHLEARWGIKPPQIALLGTSMGGQGALRFAFKYPERFPVVAALAPAIDYQIRYYDPEEETIPQMYDSPEAVRQDTATLHVHPWKWTHHIWFACDPADEKWHESSERLHSKLTALGIPHQCDLESSGGGHSWEYYDRMAPHAIEFLVSALEKEQNRLL